jgi:Ankyrin repeats (3 copies)
LENTDKVALNSSDESGYCPLHSACALGLMESSGTSSCEIIQILIEAGADLSKEDTEGNTPLHWASRAGDKEAVLLLLIKNARTDAKNKKGETPLHWAMRSGRRSMQVVAVLLDNGARASIVDSTFKRPIDVPGEGFMDEERSIVAIKARLNAGKKVYKEYKKLWKESSEERSEARANLLLRSTQSKTLVLHHPECLEHHPKSEHDWEAPDRILSIMRRIVPSSDSTGSTESSGIFPYEVTVSKEFEKASLDLLRRVHSPEYLSFVSNLSKDLERQIKEAGGSLEESEHGFAPPPAVIPFTPMVQRSMIKVEESSVKLSHLSDTAFSAGSLRAARRAAGAVQHAVDWYVCLVLSIEKGLDSISTNSSRQQCPCRKEP